MALWAPHVLGCLFHVPGHWVALTPPPGAHSEETAALLCDSLFQLNAEEVGALFAQMAVRQQGGDLQEAGEWSLNVITRCV